jgi:hypothetical protein
MADRVADLRQVSTIRAALAGEDAAKQLAEADRLRAQLLANLEGYYAQGLVGEREFAAQRRQLQGEWVQANAAALTKATADYKNYTEEIKKLDRQMAEVKSGTADLLASIKQAGMTPAEAFADKERVAQEHLASAMKLSGQEQIDALKKVQQEYGALATEATRSSDQQVAAAKAVGASLSDLPGEAFQSNVAGGSEAWKQFWKESPPSSGPNALGSPLGTAAPAYMASLAAPAFMYSLSAKPFGGGGGDPLGDAKALADKVTDIGKKLEDAYAKAKDQVEGTANSAKKIADQTSTTLTNLEKSAGAAADLAAGFDAAARAASALTDATLTTTLAQLAPSYAGRASRAGLPAELKDALQAAADQIVQDIRNPSEPTVGTELGAVQDAGQAQEGTVVPGPVGYPRMIKAHGGEMVLNEREQDVLRGLIDGAGAGLGRGGSIEVHVHLDGSTIARSQRISLQEMIRSGQLIIKAA